jgi:hypothetical protein
MYVKIEMLSGIERKKKQISLILLSGLPDGLFSNQKVQIWVNFGGPLNGKCWYIL